MTLKLAALVIVIAGLALLAYVRLAPSDPAAWHVAVATSGPLPDGRCADQIAPMARGARATCALRLSPADTLQKLEAIALTSPRVQHLAGSAAEGRITWVARSFLMGYPDYVTAEATPTPTGTRLDIISRQRFGEADSGVNAARLKDWLSQL